MDGCGMHCLKEEGGREGGRMDFHTWEGGKECLEGRIIKEGQCVFEYHDPDCCFF